MVDRSVSGGNTSMEGGGAFQGVQAEARDGNGEEESQEKVDGGFVYSKHRHQ